MRAIESVRSQTYKDTEIIVVDDNGEGTECQIETKKIVNKFDDVLYVSHETNSNGSVARNTGIKLATGKYVALLDDDDAYRNEKISKQVDVMEQKGSEYGLCYSGVQVHFPNGNIKDQISYCEGNIFELAIMRKVKAQTSGFLFRKECAEKIGLFNESFTRHQDWEFFDRMACYYKIAVVPDICVDRYITRRNSATNPRQYETNRLFYLEKMKMYIDMLEEGNKRDLYRFHYRSIAREYMKSKKLFYSMKYIVKCGNPIVTLRELIEDYRNSSLH